MQMVGQNFTHWLVLSGSRPHIFKLCGISIFLHFWGRVGGGGVCVCGGGGYVCVGGEGRWFLVHVHMYEYGVDMWRQDCCGCRCAMWSWRTTPRATKQQQSSPSWTWHRDSMVSGFCVVFCLFLDDSWHGRSRRVVKYSLFVFLSASQAVFIYSQLVKHLG